MNQILAVLTLWPVLVFLISLFIPQRSEKIISRFSFFVVAAHFICIILWTGYWSLNGFPDVNVKEWTIFHGTHLHFYIDFLFDKVTAVYSFVGGFLTFLILIYSRVYMHKEEGYKRFFSTILFFYAGYNLAVFAGNLETLFIGWEILGLTSFLLVAFYRNRYLPVKNAYKVFSIYRIGDVGIILAMWANHHLWHDNITFIKLKNDLLLQQHMDDHMFLGLFISFMILVAAAAKSAQFPFSTWLPRAMEGPTPSSAIFYGSLSVHMGLLLLLRTIPLWEHLLFSKILLVIMGVITALFGTAVSRVQSSVKSQIAYASLAQIGLMFVELALGWEVLALIHFVGNAFLRTYQLLVSPSAVSYLIREQFYHFEPAIKIKKSLLGERFNNTFYLWSLREFYMDELLDRFIWSPFKKLGNLLRFINIKNILYITLPAYILAVLIRLNQYQIPEFIQNVLPEAMAVIGLLLVLRAYAGRRNVFVVWSLLFMHHFWVLLAISFNERLSFSEISFYLSGVLVSGVVGYLTLYYLKKREPGMDLDSFQGHIFEYPKMSMLFLIASMGLAGFPITPTFVGEDILFAHIDYDQIFLAFYLSLSFIMSGIALIRMYSRVFLGPHVKKHHETGLKSG